MLTLILPAILAIASLTPADQLQFETVSVKPADQCKLESSLDPGMIALNGFPISAILAEAFKVKRDQIVGPSWLDSACYTINAKMPEGATRDQLPE